MSVRAPVPELCPGERVLDADTSKYLCLVRRLREGDPFVAFDPETRTEADGVVLQASSREACVRIDEVRPASVVAHDALVVIYALAKGDKVDAVVRDATELGATRIVLASTERSIVKAKGEHAQSKLERWRKIAEQAARQSGRADTPEIEGVLSWDEALRSASACAARFCLDPHATKGLGPPLLEHVAQHAGIAFAIGPEGGLSPSEVERANMGGFLPVTLGPFVLRTETVAAAVLGAVRILATASAPAAMR
jgi:16S rRNA (uracil1498-N3)-methyltransferase